MSDLKSSDAGIAKAINSMIEGTANVGMDVFGLYKFNQWGTIHKEAVQNDSFFGGNKSGYMEDILSSEFETNLDVIPRLQYNLTEYIIKQQARLYTKATVINAEKGKDLKEHFDTNAFILSLQGVNKDFYLHGVGFLKADARSTSDTILFSRISPSSIIYASDMSEYMFREGSVFDYNIYRYVFNKDVVLSRLEKEIKLSKDNDLLKLRKFSLGKLKSKWNEVVIYAKSFQGAMDVYNISYTNKAEDVAQFIESNDGIKNSYVFEVFATEYKTASLSSVINNEIYLSLMYGFGMAGVPMELLSKLILTTSGASSAGSNSSDITEQLSDLLAIITLKEGETITQLTTEKLAAMTALTNIFEVMVNQIAVMKGLTSGIFSTSSGNSQMVAEKSASIFTGSDVLKFNVFESKIFKYINKIAGSTIIKDQSIDKSSSKLSLSSEILNEMILAVTNGFVTPQQALMNYHHLDATQAQTLLDSIMEAREKYGELQAGLVGQSNPQEATSGGMAFDSKDSEKGNQNKDSDETKALNV